MNSRELLVEHYSHFESQIGICASRLPAHLRDECESEAQVAMVEAADQWNPTSSRMTFVVFVSWRMRQRMVDAARSFSNYERSTGECKYVPLARDSDRPTLGGDPHERAVVHERMIALVKLPRRLRQALSAETPAIAAELLGVSESRISQMRKQARALCG